MAQAPGACCKRGPGELRAARRQYLLLRLARDIYRELFLHAYDLHLGMGDKWPEPPEVYRKMCEAKDPAAVLERFKPEDPKRAFVNVAELFDTDALVNQRRLVLLLAVEPPEDLSE
jgi:hypothetical protein